MSNKENTIDFESKEYLVLDSEYMRNTLKNILKYIDEGGTDLDRIHAEAFDGIYESCF